MTGADRINALVEQTRRRLGWPAWLSAYGPPVLAILLFLTLAAFGLFEAMPAVASTLLSLIFALVIALLGWRGLLAYRKPTTAEGRDLVDGLSEDRPATAMIDRPARPTRENVALWEANRQRIAEQAATLGKPSLSALLRTSDPFYLRFAAPALLFGALIHAGPEEAASRIAAAASPDLGALAGADKLQVQAWVAPPAHTNRAPFVLEDGVMTSSPQGSDVTIRVDAPRAPTLRLEQADGASRIKMEQAADGAFETNIKLDEGLEAEVQFWGTRAQYFLTSSPDLPPSISFVEAPTTDKLSRIDFNWTASDDYGVQQVELVLTPVAPPHGIENQSDTIALNLPGVDPETATARAQLDLLRHKWAGLDVNAYLRAIDASGQSGASESHTFRLPEKLMFQPLARAAAEVRLEVLRDPRDYAAPTPAVQTVDIDKVVEALPSRLERAPDGVRTAALMLDGLTFQPETYFLDPVLFMGFSRAKSMLHAARDADAAAQTDDLLWAVAMRAEYGSFADAEMALEAARKALERALRDGASEEEIQRLMEAFKQAVTDYLAMQMAEALKRGSMGEQQGDMANKAVGGDDLQRMLETLQDLAETGATDQARQLLSDMTEMLSRMKDFQFSEGGEGGQPPPEGPMADALRQLGEQLMQQRELNDSTRQAQRQEQDAQEGLSSAPSQSQMQDLAQRQQDLADQLRDSLENQQGEGQPGMGEQGDSQSGAGGEQDGSEGGQGPGGDPGDSDQPPEALGGTSAGQLGDASRDQRIGDPLEDAQRAQEEAAEALARGELDAAERAQNRAARALSEASRQLAERADELSRQSGLQPQDPNQDPLGRPTGTGAIGDGDETQVPEQLDRQRARDILDELRRRAAKRDLTPEEEDYLRRLLDRF